MSKKIIDKKNLKALQFIIIVMIMFSYSILYSDLGSISPTINARIYPDEWDRENVGYPGHLTQYNPAEEFTIQANPPAEDYDVDDEHIQYLIDNAPANMIVEIILLSGTYKCNAPIIINDPDKMIILKGDHEFKKDWDERTILEFNITTGLNPENKNCLEFKDPEFGFITHSGVEDVYIKRLDTSGNPTGTRTGDNVYMENCENCFVSGVESYYPQNHHVTMYDCNNIEVRGCYFHYAQDFDQGGSGYGVVCDNSNHCLIEDNIFDYLRHSMLVQNDSQYNVFGYNFSTGAHQENDQWYMFLAPENFSGDMVCHGHPEEEQSGPIANLFEGNKGQFMWVDNFHDANGRHNTFMRNSARKYGYFMAWFQFEQNFVNNHLKCNNWFLCNILGFPRYRLLASSYFESDSQIEYVDLFGFQWSDFLSSNIWLLLYDLSNHDTSYHDKSYYCDTVPDFIGSAFDWPFDPKNDENPAEIRYGYGDKKTKSRFDTDAVVTKYLHSSISIPDNPGCLSDWVYNYGDNGYLKIPPFAALVIEPENEDITLSFDPGFRLWIEGLLIAKGTEEDSIYFTSNSNWYGVHMIATEFSSDAPQALFEYCKFDSAVFASNTMAGGAISADICTSRREDPDLIVRNCTFQDNNGKYGGAIYFRSWDNNLTDVVERGYCIIENCLIKENTAYDDSDDYGGAGIYLTNTEAIIRNNIIHDNTCSESSFSTGGGIEIRGSSSEIPISIVNNLIYKNQAEFGSGVFLYNNEDALLFNNTIYNNIDNAEDYHEDLRIKFDDCATEPCYIAMCNNSVKKGLVTIQDSDIDYYFDYYNNHIRYNYYSTEYGIIDVYNFDSGTFVDLDGTKIDNFEGYPYYIDPNSGNFNFQFNSPLRESGISQSDFLQIDNLDINDWDLIPADDLGGDPRIAGELIDVGAYEYYEPGIYLPQKEIDFGGVPHDRAATMELVIKNIGSVDLTNIEITFADTIAEYYTIDPEDIPAVIPPSQTDSVCIPIKFCCHKMFVHCDGLITITSSDTYIPKVQILVYGKPALDNYWNWISFPALDRDASGNQDAEEVLEPLVPNAHKLITQVGDMIYNLELNQWDHNELDDIVSTVGYKLKMFNNYAYYPFSMVGDSISLIPADTEIHLEAGYNWIGYWLPQSQNIDVAFGPDNFEKVHSIQAENWYYSLPESIPDKGDPNQSSPCPSTRIRPLHYGRGYIVNVTEEFDLTWTDPGDNNTKEEGYEETEAFSYNEKETYEVIDVIGLDGSAQEIGVFNSGAECLGAAKIDSLGSAQILAYTDTQAKEGTELTFCIYQGKSIKESNNYLLYDFKSQEFIQAPLKAGIRKYNIVMFDSNNPQLLDKLILQQNVPNPFNHKMKSTSISFALPQKDKVMLKIYNIKGQLIKTVIDNKEMDAGYYTVQWDGRNEENKKVCNGVYLYKIENSNSSIIKKMIILE